MTAAVRVDEVGPERAGEVTRTIHLAFGDRPALDPPTTALHETETSVGKALAEHGGLLATWEGEPVGALLFDPDGGSLGLRRVSVVPAAQRRGVAALLAAAAEEYAERHRFRRMTLVARSELPGTVRFWLREGYRETGRDGTSLTLGKELPVRCVVPTAEAMGELGRRLAGLLRAGDLVLLSGDLGAGKTTLTRGLGAGLGVRGEITSPTFVIARVHPSLVGGPALVHADAYRLGGIEELDDLDLDVTVADSVTVVEWGAGLAEGLADDRLEVAISRPTGLVDGGGPGGPVSGPDAEPRTVRLVPVGARWVGSDLADVVTGVVA